MALNSVDAPEPKYRMWNTWEVPATVTPEHMLGWVAIVASGAPGGKLQNLILNAHGNSGWIRLGTGFRTMEHLSHFEKVRGLVGQILILACKVASITEKGDGNKFCSEMAKRAGADVIVSSNYQVASLVSLPDEHIDEWEGKVWKYKRTGGEPILIGSYGLLF
jgi:hypothetical protein